MATNVYLPYNPSNIFLLPNSDTAYIFRSSEDSPNQAKLFAFPYKNGFDSKSEFLITVSDTVPFLQGDKAIAYNPSIGPDGSITVVAGDCSDGTEGAKVWTFLTDTDDSDRNGSGKWTEHDTRGQDLGQQESLAGANFLANVIAFSQSVNGSAADTTIYAFGGMCPQGISSSSTWQNDADYSNEMLRLSQQTSGSDPKQYDISTLENRGPPIAQAGSTLTGLPVTYWQSSNDGEQTQQQDFVLLGGHTQVAFVNTSQVAVFSLPQASWSFVPVQQPSSAKTDLALARRQDILEVTPRSGHTAVLSEDGSSITVLGGWVGSVETPASPQLAILDMSTGGEWSWNIPEQSSSGPGAGIFGHGAAMLPGNVMMVTGGFSIADTPSRLVKRATPSVSEGVHFYNVSSGSWLDTYRPPEGLGNANDSSGPLSQTSQKVGLGTGLGFGAALLASVVVFYFWYSKRLRRAREDRQRTLLAHSSDGSYVGRISQPFLNDSGFDGRGGDEAAVGRFWPTGGAAGGDYQQPPEMQHTTGMFVNVPSPTRGLRKASNNRNYQYHAAPRFDENKISRASGNIHPIAEQANEDGDEHSIRSGVSDDLNDAERKLKDLERVLMSGDPFADEQPNPLGSHPVSAAAPLNTTVMRVPTIANRPSHHTIPRRPVSGEAEASNWYAQRAPHEALLEDDNGRVSPTKSSSDDRTSSTLSERSTRTTTSDTSITRTMSTRTGALLAAAAAAYRAPAVKGEKSPTDERSHTMSTNGGRKSPYDFSRPRSNTAGSQTPGARHSIVGDADSFITARSNFVDLQSEGEALLGGRPDDPYQRAVAAQQTTVQPPQTHSQPIPASLGSFQKRKRGGLMGSLRKALNVVNDRSFSLTGPSDQYLQDSTSSSPTHNRPTTQIGSTPRRAVSDGGALLKQKRGQQDWQNDKVFAPYHDDPDPNDWGEPVDREKAEAEWDVEGEVTKRDVQVMFTVPKSRLRVVNDDMDRASLRSASDGAVSRNNSLRRTESLRTQDSVKGLRARSEGERGALAEVLEEGEKEKAA